MAKGLKIWKTIMLASLLCLLLALGGGMLACNPGESHTHSWSETYSYDDDNHWLSCSGCEQRTGTEAHVFDNDQDTTCNVCGYTRHVHTLVWKNDGNVNGKHWQEYSCEHHSDERLNEGDHVWGNDNICDVCLLDKTPPHVHHEITRYDETQHWTTYDCTEHGNEKINPQPHTFTNGSKCDGCDYDRDAEHQHSLSGWIHNNDPQYHWKEYTCWHHADEQLEKTPHNFNGDDECDDCGYERAHDHNNYLIWNFNDIQHWQTSTCHPADAGEKNRGSHSFGDNGVCECGLDKSYIDVYNIYKAYEQAKGESAISEFTAWYTSLKTQNVDHVGVNATGDAVFYSSKEDTTGTVMYYGERTVNVNTNRIADVWVVIKLTVSGQEPKVLDIKKSTTSGVILNFIPVVKDNATYTVSIADEQTLSDIDEAPIPMPANHIITDGNASFDITPFEQNIFNNIKFDIVRGLGLDGAGGLDGVSLSQYMDAFTFNEYYFANPGDWEEGWYRIDFTSKSQFQASGLYFSLEIGEQGNMLGTNLIPTSGSLTSAFGIFELTQNNKKFYIRWSGVGGLTGRLVLSKLEASAFEIKNNQNYNLIVNQPDTVEPVEYDLSKLEPGVYKISHDYQDNSENSTANEVSFKINDGQNITFGSTRTIEITAETKKLVLTQTHKHLVALGEYNVISSFTLHLTKLNTFVTNDEYTIKLNELQDGFKVEGTSNNHQGYYYVLWNPAETGAYKLTLTGTPEFAGIKVELWNLAWKHGTVSSRYLIDAATTATPAESYTATFGATGQAKYYLGIYTNDKDNSQYPEELTIKIEKLEGSAFDVNEEVTATFSEGHTELSYVGHLNAGVYVIYLMGETLDNVSVKLSVGTKDTTVSKSTRFNTLIVDESTDATVICTYTGSENYPTVKFIVIEVNGGTDISDNMTSITANLSADKYFQVFSFTETEENYYQFLLKSAKNLQNVYGYCATYEPDKAATVVKWLGADSAETMQRDYIFPDINNPYYYYANSTVVGAKYVIVLIADKTADVDYPGEITVSINKSLYTPGIDVIYTNLPRVRFDLERYGRATKYELWLATLPTAGTPMPEMYELVKTLEGEELAKASYNYNKLYSFTVTERNKLGNYFYWKLVLKDETGEYVDFVTTTVEKNGGKQGTQYKSDGATTYVTVECPNGYEGDVTVSLYNSSSSTADKNLYGMGTVHVEKGQSEVVVEVFSPNYSSGTLYIRLDVSDGEKYTMPAVLGTLAGSNDARVSFTNRVAITATIELPDGFTAKEGEDLTVTLYKGTTTTVAATGVATIDESRKTATAVIYADTNAAGYTAAITRGLDTGYAASETKYNVELAEDGKTGTVTLAVNQRTAVNFEITIPAHFTGGEITLDFYIYTGEQVATRSTANFKFRFDANDTEEPVKHNVTAYLPMGDSYQVKLSGPFQSGYVADIIEKIDLNSTTVSAQFNVLERAEITANIELPGESTATQVTLILYDTTINNSLATKTIQVTLDESSGKKKGSEIFYGAKGHEFRLASTDTSALTSTADFEMNDVNFTVDGSTGSATIVGELKYIVNVTVGFSSESDARAFTHGQLGSVYLYQERTKLIAKAQASVGNYIGSGANKHWTVSFYLSKKHFVPDANYYIAAPYYGLTASYFIFPTTKVDWSEEKTQTDLDIKLIYEKTPENFKTIEYTINVPEEYTETGNHNLDVFDVYGIWDKTVGSYSTGTTGKSRIVVSFADIQEHKITGTFDKYPESTLLYFNLTGGKLNNIMANTSSNNFFANDWYAEPSAVTYDEEGKGHVTIDIKKTTPIKLKIPALSSFNGMDAPQFNMLICLKDKDGNVLSNWSYSVPKNATAEGVDFTLRTLKWEEGYKAEVTLSKSGSNEIPYALAEINPAEFKDEAEGKVLQVNLIKYLSAKVTIPNLDNTVPTSQFAVTLVIKDGGTEICTRTINVTASASADYFSSYILIPVTEWKDSYTIEATTTADAAYKITGGTHKLEDADHLIEINATKKEALKVKISGLNPDTANTQLTATLTVKDSEAHVINTFSIKIPASSSVDTFAEYVYLDSWAAGYTVEVSGMSTEYVAKSAAIGADDAGVHTATITLELKPKVKIVLSGLGCDEIEAKAFAFNVIIKDHDGNEINSIPVNVAAKATDSDFTPVEQYIDKAWEEDFDVEFSVTSFTDYVIKGGVFSDGDNGVHLLTITLEEQPYVKVSIPKLDAKYNAKRFGFNILVKDGSNLQKGTINVSVPENQGADYSYMAHFKTFEGLENVKFEVTPSYYASEIYNINSCTFSKESDGVYTVTVDVEVKLSVKVLIPGLKSEFESVAFTLNLKILDNGKVMEQANISVPKDQGEDFEYVYYFKVITEWKDSFTAEVSVDSSYVTRIPYVITTSAELTAGDTDRQHNVTVTVTPKQFIKVVLSGLDGTVAVQTSLLVKINDNDGVQVGLVRISIPANAVSAEAKLFIEKEWADYKVDLEYREEENAFRIVSGVFSAGSYDYEHILTLNVAKRIAITVTGGTCPGALTRSKAATVKFNIKNSNSEVIGTGGVRYKQFGTTFEKTTFYIDSYEPNCTLEVTSISTMSASVIDNYNYTYDLQVDGLTGTLTFTVTAK